MVSYPTVHKFVKTAEKVLILIVVEDGLVPAHPMLSNVTGSES